MTSHDLSLLGLPHDVRLELFSWLTLPPLGGCEDYAGLWLSCREFHSDANREGTRRLRIHLQNLSQRGSDEASESSPGNDAPRHTLHFQAPPSIYNHPVIHVKVPLLLPPETHDWHFLKPPQRMCGTGLRHLLSTPGPRRDRYLAESDRRNECRRQKELYIQRVRALTGPLADLHSLYVRVEIQLVADEDVMRVIAKKVFARHLDRRFELTSVVLGKVLEVYVSEVSHQSFIHMRQGSGDLERRAGECSMAWNFTSGGSTVRREDKWRPSLCSWEDNYRDALASFTEDRREGSVQFGFDVEAYLQEKSRGGCRTGQQVVAG